MEVAPDDFSSNRPYRSKRHRPCDTCRARKVCCRIDTEPPCYLCRKNGTTCTYLQLPTKKRKLVEGLEESESLSAGVSDNSLMAGRPTSPPEEGATASAMDYSEFLPGLSPFDDSLPLLDIGDEHEPNLPTLRGMFSFPTLSEIVTSQVDSPTRVDQFYNTPDGFVQFLLERDSYSNPAGDDLVSHSSPKSLPKLQQANAGVAGTNPNGITSPCISASSSSHIPPTFTVGTSKSAGTEVCSIDDTEGFSAQYFGLSGESDPFLLNHIKYDENNERRYFKVHFRKAAEAFRHGATGLIMNGHDNTTQAHSASPAASMPDISSTIPVQFMMTAKELTVEKEKDTAFRPEVSREGLRQELDALISPDDGQRLINL